MEGDKQIMLKVDPETIPVRCRHGVHTWSYEPSGHGGLEQDTVRTCIGCRYSQGIWVSYNRIPRIHVMNEGLLKDFRSAPPIRQCDRYL